MKVLLFTLEYPPFFGGVANYYGNIVKYWPGNSEIFVLNNNGGKLVNNKLPFLKWLPSFYYLWKTVRANKIEHILVGHILPLGTVAYLFTKIFKPSYSVVLHGMDINYALKTERKKKLAKKILNNAKNVICANSYAAGMARRMVRDEAKIVVVNPGVENKAERDEKLIGEIKERYDLDGKFVLLSIGRLVKRKGFDKVIESLPDIFNVVPNLRYFIAGSGPEEEYLKSKAGELFDSFKDRVVFLGKISEEEKWAWLETCDTFIMPARNIDGDIEGFGIVYLEANLCGKPVIAGDSGGVRDAVRHEGNGLLVKPENTSEISNAIFRLANNKKLRQKLGKNGQSTINIIYDWSIKAGEISNLL